MFIVTVDAAVAPENHLGVLQTLQDATPTIRQLPGNLSFRPLVGPEPGRLTILQEWETPDAFAGYQAHAIYTDINAALGPMLIEPPVIRRYAAEPLE